MLIRSLRERPAGEELEIASDMPFFWCIVGTTDGLREFCLNLSTCHTFALHEHFNRRDEKERLQEQLGVSILDEPPTAGAEGLETTGLAEEEATEY